jgi:arginine exporter protein ArgO
MHVRAVDALSYRVGPLQFVCVCVCVCVQWLQALCALLKWHQRFKCDPVNWYGLNIYVFCVDLRTNSYYFPIQH